MSRPADAIVTGFAKSPALAEASLAPLRRLRQEGVLRSIVCVTWDGPDVDDYVDWVDTMPDVSIERVPQPDAGGTPNQRGVVYQIENLRAALAVVPDEDDLVLKTRPDFVADAEFLRNKITTFDDWSRVPSRSVLGIEMPKHALGNKIWIPWADSNQPFFYEDATFLGRKRDLQKLAVEPSVRDMEILGEPSCGSFAHVVRYSKAFLTEYPLFARYLRDYRYFVSDLDYRVKLVTHMQNEGFFWHLVIAHAWILQSQFHVDAGKPGDLRFYSNTANRDADWSNPQTLKLANPYDTLETWRSGTRPNEATHTVRRAYGRLVDDAWQHTLFVNQSLQLSRTTLVRLLAHIANCSDGRLDGIENDFYRGLDAFYRMNWTPRAQQQFMAKAS